MNTQDTRAQSAQPPEIRTVTIPACAEHRGAYALRVRLRWVCPQCGQPRGGTSPGKRWHQGRALDVDGWENPCGHADDYAAVRAEAAANGLNGLPKRAGRAQGGA